MSSADRCLRNGCWLSLLV